MQLSYYSFSSYPPELPDDLVATGRDHTLAIAFGPSNALDNPVFFDRLRERLPHAHLIGCSTAGEIHQDRILDGSLVLALLRFEHSRLRGASTPVETADGSRRAGKRLAEALYGPDLRAIFVLSDGLGVNGTELIRGLNGVLGNRVAVTGGLAGDGSRFQRTWVLDDGGIGSRIVAAVGLYGDRLSIRHGSRGGWDKFGIVRTVTRAEGNTLYELNGRPALDLYKEYLGERAEELPASALLFPLAILSDSEDEQPLVRTVLGVDGADNSMTFAGDIPLGARVQLMRANLERLIDGATEAALAIGEGGAGDAAGLLIAISCVGRRLVLGERTEEELESVQRGLPAHMRQIGFYSYGEISPVTRGACELHNQTMTLTSIGEI